MKTIRHPAFLILVVCRITIATSTIITEDLCVEADHYLSYPFNPPVSLINLGDVTLNDQFIASPQVFTILDAARLLNPAIKSHNGKIEEPKRPNTHYVALSVEPADGSFIFSDISSVNVFNQFDSHGFNIPGDLVLDDGNPSLELLVPSLKKACPGGQCPLNTITCDGCFPEGDNYLCYELNVLSECQVNASFEDQFIMRTVEELIPSRLCNPVSILPSGPISLLVNEATNHLLCYEISRMRIPPQLVRLLNRFGVQTGLVRINDEVCVPSTLVVSGICGNGILEAGEQCDDGNQDPFDGCEPNCTLSLDCDPTDPDFGFIQGIPRYVDPSGDPSPANDCTNQTNPCATIAHAIIEANPADTVVLSAATFFESNLIVDKNLFIFGHSPKVSIVDAMGEDRVFTVNRDIEATFCGLQITGGQSISFGGGIFNLGNGTTNIRSSTISGNTASMFSGGGIFNLGATINLTNSTISGNTAARFGGGIDNEGTTNINDSTITQNSAFFDGGGIFNLDPHTTNVFNSIVAHQLIGTDCTGGIVDNGFNIDKDGSCSTFNTFPAFSLPPLADNGGPTLTHALIAGGMGTEAIDFGNTTCGVTTDQRGEPRPQNIVGIDPIDAQARCDIGSFELQP